jgi:hypothetical protein
MKAIKMRIQKSSRPLVILLATVVATITCVTVANATQTITTPNAAFISFSLATGTNSAAITPATSRSVLVMGCCTTSGDTGVGQVSLQHIPSTAMLWVGLESFTGPPFTTTTTAGGSSQAFTHIVWIDVSHTVDIEVASVDTIRVHNGSAGTRAGNVTLIW